MIQRGKAKVQSHLEQIKEGSLMTTYSIIIPLIMKSIPLQ
ncbi:hypothetical protein KP509_13G033900 [Ceratopteris richardii]|uniref:Uncharacterized protein n=1 Tax=Ceratopteris richardii TaxID=49495 RepID=A0A8T2TGT2_CERRI|nr:hypothetical protein KP509_13G033900 [Ceratopteris richardii]